MYIPVPFPQAFATLALKLASRMDEPQIVEGLRKLVEPSVEPSVQIVEAKAKSVWIPKKQLKSIKLQEAKKPKKTRETPPVAKLLLHHCSGHRVTVISAMALLEEKGYLIKAKTIGSTLSSLDKKKVVKCVSAPASGYYLYQIPALETQPPLFKRL